jgi:hypothetical protein
MGLVMKYQVIEIRDNAVVWRGEESDAPPTRCTASQFAAQVIAANWPNISKGTALLCKVDGVVYDAKGVRV